MSVAKLKIKGKVTRAVIKHGMPLQDALKNAANRYVDHAQRAANTFAGNFAEYLSFYVPQIENFVLQEIQKDPDYFKNDDAGKNARIRLAAEVAMKNSELAAEWRRMRRLEVISKKINTSGTLKQYARQGTTTSTSNIVMV